MPEGQKSDRPRQSPSHARIPGSFAKEINGWAQEFLATVAADPTARSAWQKLRQAGLDRPALYPLWKYAHSDSEFERLRKDAKRKANQVRDTIRALRIAKSGQKPKRAKDALVFYRRALEHLTKLDQPLDWPFLWEDESPLAMHDKISKSVGSPLSLELLEGHFKWLSGRNGTLRREAWLRKLQEFAARGGVVLGLKVLVALAECADPSISVNYTTLSRVFRRWDTRSPTLHLK
jgi:hypothetical protein